MRVLMPNGALVEYQKATYANRDAMGFTDLYTKKPADGGQWLAQVPNTAMIQVGTPSKTTPAGIGTQDALEILLDAAKRRDGDLSGYKLRDLKRLLDGFDSRRKEWKS